MRLFNEKARIALCCILLGAAAFAQNIHLKPPNSTPSFLDNGLTLTASGFLAGLGNGDILVELFASAQATAICTNPAGATQPPRAESSASGGGRAAAHP